MQELNGCLQGVGVSTETERSDRLAKENNRNVEEEEEEWEQEEQE